MDRDWLVAPPKLFVFWHSRQLMMPWFFLTQRRSSANRISVLISRHSDGRIIAGAVNRLGIESVAGSSSRGAAAASRQLLSLTKQGSHIAITPDGPKGPAEKVKEGLVQLARLGSVTIYPTAYACSSYWQIKSWDRMIIPKPFSRGVFALGRAIEIPQALESEKEYESYRLKVEQGISEVTGLAERELANVVA